VERRTNNGPQRWFKFRLWWTSNFNSNTYIPSSEPYSSYLPIYQSNNHPFLCAGKFVHWFLKTRIISTPTQIQTRGKKHRMTKSWARHVWAKMPLPRNNYFSIFLRADSTYWLHISRGSILPNRWISPHIGISSIHRNNTNFPLKTYAVSGHWEHWKRLPYHQRLPARWPTLYHPIFVMLTRGCTMVILACVH